MISGFNIDFDYHYQYQVGMNRFGLMCCFMACGAQERSEDVSSDAPLAALSAAWQEQFTAGDALFDNAFRESDGLGPVYIRSSCGACHAGAGRGPGTVERLVQVGSDGLTWVTGQPALAFGSAVKPRAVGGASPLMAPDRTDVLVRTRLAQPVMGRGYLDAISDDVIEALALTQLDQGLVSGRVNHVLNASNGNSDERFHQHEKGQRLVGRFGFKARQATLDDFAADAFWGDMGMTSHMRPTEALNKEGILDDAKMGVDVNDVQLNAVANYVRTIAIPGRDVADVNGVRLFEQAKCGSCHVPEILTRIDYPIEALANVVAPIYCDLLLHDLGPSMADSIVEGEASGSEWRTAPLIGIRFLKSYLHDGRADSVEAAIAAHGDPESEARFSVELFNAMSVGEKQLLVKFVNSL
jgi:CxxC motif-containing protein (DUF1111 family)